MNIKYNALIVFLLISVTSLAQVAEKAEDISPLLIGETVPTMKVTTVENKIVLTSDLFKKAPTVLLFYRGGWCPYCNAHLAAVGELSEEIRDLGYQIVAVSPDSPDKLMESLEKQDLDYQLISDANGQFSQVMGLAYSAPEEYTSLLSNYSGGGNTGFLPVPALFVVDTKGVILFEYISPDYKNRIQSPLLLEVLKHFSSKNPHLGFQYPFL